MNNLCRLKTPIMTLAEDFADAHGRHLKDAEQFFRQPRWANADHLYGLSAECGLKAVLDAEGQPVAVRYRNHVDRLWRQFQTFAAGRTGVGNLSLLPVGEPFRDWCIDQRYAHQSNFGRARVEPHRDAARAIRAMVQHAIQGGRP